jgi:hypothetical protein
MEEPLDEIYLKWLYSQVASTRWKNPTRTYWRLLRQLYTKEFVWFVPNDDNRATEGRDLREEFLETSGLDIVDENWMTLGCSFLEMLISLSRRLEFETRTGAREWFWCLLRNLGLGDVTDAVENPQPETIDEILNAVIWRTYQFNGQGGLFPLLKPDRDQRQVELWYQLNAYLIELQTATG